MAYTQLYSDEQSSQAAQGREQRDVQIFKNKSLVPVPVEFVLDKFNHTGLDEFLSDYQAAYQQLQVAVQNSNEALISNVESVVLYGLLHKRFLESEPGLQLLYKNIVAKNYGVCLRQGCDCLPLAPIGVSPKPGVAPFCTYCYNCRQVYEYYGRDEVDGSFFGENAANLLLLSQPDLLLKFKEKCGAHDEPMQCGTKLYGFEICYDRLQATPKAVR